MRLACGGGGEASCGCVGVEKRLNIVCGQGGQGGHRAGAPHRDGDSLRPGALLHEPSNAGCHHGLDGGASACRRRPGVPANPGRCHLCLSDLLGLPKMRAVHFLRLSLSKIGWGGRIHTGGQNKVKQMEGGAAMNTRTLRNCPVGAASIQPSRAISCPRLTVDCHLAARTCLTQRKTTVLDKPWRQSHVGLEQPGGNGVRAHQIIPMPRLRGQMADAGTWKA